METSAHFFCMCVFGAKLLRWLGRIIGRNLIFIDLDELWNLCIAGMNPQIILVLKVASIFLINSVLSARNMACFNNKITHFYAIISNILAQIMLNGNNYVSTTTSSMHDFSLIKALNVTIHPPRAPTIKEVISNPHIFNWIKCNCDGAFTISPCH